MKERRGDAGTRRRGDNHHIRRLAVPVSPRLPFTPSSVRPPPHTVRLTSKPCEFPYGLIDSSRKMHVASSLLLSGRRNSFSLHARTRREEKRLKMIKLMRELMVILLLGVVSAGAFAQRKDKDKRPPKEKVVVVTNSNKDNRPPPRNSNQQPRPRPRPE